MILEMVVLCEFDPDEVYKWFMEVFIRFFMIGLWFLMYME